MAEGGLENGFSCSQTNTLTITQNSASFGGLIHYGGYSCISYQDEPVLFKP